jgi:hypothetical protein
VHGTGSRIKNKLKTVDLRCREVEEKRVAIVYPEWMIEVAVVEAVILVSL